MTLRSSVRKGVDFARLGQALARPGIDPRIWVSTAIITSEATVDMEPSDGSAGVFVDVLLLPSQLATTARLGAAYAGNGFGFYTPLHVDDEVLVCAPSGDPANGLVVVQRLWSASDPPPQDVADNPQDVVLVTEADKNVRLRLQGAGSVFLDIADGGSLTLNVVGSGDVQLNVDGGKVFLGANSSTEPAAKATSLKTYLENLQSAIAGHTHVVTGTCPAGAVAGNAAVSPAVFPSPTSAIVAEKVEVK